MPLWLRTAIFTLIMPGSITVWAPAWLRASGLATRSLDLGTWRLAGVLPLAAGVACYLWCAWDFGFAGRGTPGPWDAPRDLVARGLYRWVRNPMYVGVLLVLLGESILFESAALTVYAVAVWGAFNVFVLAYEEPTLRSRFGATYEAYCRAVPRWVPNVHHRPRSS